MAKKKSFKKIWQTFFFGQWIQSATNQQSGVIQYGKDDSFPIDNLKAIADSAIAKRATSKLRKYIKGFGWTPNKEEEEDVEIGKFVVNEAGQTSNQLLSKIASNLAYYRGCGLLIRRNLKGKVKDVTVLFFPGIRKKDDGSFTYNPKAGTSEFKQDQTKIYPAFTKAELTTDEMSKHIQKHGNKGEILYFYEDTPENEHYPVPEYYAGIEDIRTSSELQKMDLEVVLNGFQPSSILVTEEYDDEEEDEDGKTAADYMEKQIKMFTGSEKGKDGLSGRFKLAWIQVRQGEQEPKLLSYDAKTVIDASNAKRDVIERAVGRWFGFHPVLLGYDSAQVLGNDKAIANATAELVREVEDIQTLIEENFSKIWPSREWTINKFNVIDYIPPEVWNVLTDDEKRAVAGYEALTEEQRSQQNPNDDPVN